MKLSSKAAKKEAKRKAKEAAAATDAANERKPIKAVEEWREDADGLYHVGLAGTGQEAVIPASGKAEAKERFFQLFGIRSTEREIFCHKTDEDHGLPVDCNGVVNQFHRKDKRPKQDNDGDDD